MRSFRFQEVINVAIQEVCVKTRKIKQSLIQQIHAKALELKRVPKLSDMLFTQRFITVFGSWNEALHAAGLPLAKSPRLRLAFRSLQGQGYLVSDEGCLESLKRLSGILGGYRPTTTDIESEIGAKAGCPSSSVIISRFGGMDNALRAAGLDHIQYKRKAIRDENREKEESEAYDFLKGKSFVMLSDVPEQGEIIRSIAKKEGIPIVCTPKHRELQIVLGWMRGQACGDVVLSQKEIESGMGKKAYEILVQYCQGVSMADIGRLIGVTRERVRQVVTKKATELVQSILREKGGV
jgi:hypothetical protein